MSEPISSIPSSLPSSLRRVGSTNSLSSVSSYASTSSTSSTASDRSVSSAGSAAPAHFEGRAADDEEPRPGTPLTGSSASYLNSRYGSPSAPRPEGMPNMGVASADGMQSQELMLLQVQQSVLSNVETPENAAKAWEDKVASAVQQNLGIVTP